MKKKIMAVILVLLLVLTACGKKKDVEKTNPNFHGTVKLFAYALDSVNPLETKYQTNAMTLSVMYNSLVTQEQDLSITNDIIKNYIFSDDGMSCTFTLKGDFNFSDGTRLTASNVKNSLDCLKNNPENAFYKVFDYITSYSVLSDYEFKVQLNAPGNSFLTYMNFPIIKSKSEPIGSGPYTISEKNEDMLVLKATSQFRTNISQINILLYPSDEIAVNSFLTNETNVISTDFYKFAQISAKTNVNKINYTSDNYTFLGFNNQNIIFADTNVRKSIASLIDKKNMVKTILVGYATPTNSPYKPGSIYHNLNKNDYSPSKEKSLDYLKRSQLEFNNVGFTILVNSESLAKVKTAEYISQELNEAGMNTNVYQTSYEDYLNRIDSGNYDAFIGEYTMAQDYCLDFIFGDNTNCLKYSSPALNEMLNGYRSSTDYENKLSYANEIQKYLLNDLPLISLYYRTNILSADESIKGDIVPLQTNIYNHLNKWVVSK